MRIRGILQEAMDENGPGRGSPRIAKNWGIFFIWRWWPTDGLKASSQGAGWKKKSRSFSYLLPGILPRVHMLSSSHATYLPQCGHPSLDRSRQFSALLSVPN